MHSLPSDALQRFVEIHESLVAERSWYQDASSLRFAAMAALTCSGTPQEVAAGIRARDGEIKAKLGWLHAVPAQLRMVVGSLLHLHDESPYAFLDEVERVRALFRSAGLRRYKVYELMAILILRTRNGGRPVEEASVHRLKALWEEMKSHHYWLTGADDYPACAVLVHQPGSPREIVRRAEEIYQSLHGRGMSRGNDLQTAANVLCLADAPSATIARRFADLYQGFRDAGLYMLQEDYDELAVLSFLDHPQERVIERVLEHRTTIANLRPKPDRQTSFNLASSTAFYDLVLLDRDLKEITDVKALLDIQAVIQAQQAAVTVVAATAASTAATSSGNSSC